MYKTLNDNTLPLSNYVTLENNERLNYNNYQKESFVFGDKDKQYNNMNNQIKNYKEEFNKRQEQNSLNNPNHIPIEKLHLQKQQLQNNMNKTNEK